MRVGRFNRTDPNHLLRYLAYTERKNRSHWQHRGSCRACNVVLQSLRQTARNAVHLSTHRNLAMRQPKPFFRKQTQSWYVKVDGKFRPLGKDEDQPWNEYHKIMAAPDNIQPPYPAA